MSDAQLVVYNDAGIEQVSLGGINLALVHKEVINSMSAWTATSGPQAAGLKYSFTVSAVAPIVAIATSVAGQNGAVFATATNTGTNQWRIDLFGGATATTSTEAGVSTLNAEVVAYVFDEAPAPSSGPGFALYDATGKCIFNAAYPAARVKQMLDDSNNVHGYGTSVIPPSGKTYAAIQRSNWGQQIIGYRSNVSNVVLVNEYRCGVSGGFNGASMQLGYGYGCFINGSISAPPSVPGGVGAIYATFGCVTGSTYFGDALVLDVTNL